MRARVVKAFRDRRDWAVLHAVGDVVDVDAARMAELMRLGLAVEAESADGGAVKPAAAQEAPRRSRPKGKGRS